MLNESEYILCHWGVNQNREYQYKRIKKTYQIISQKVNINVDHIRNKSSNNKGQNCYNENIYRITIFGN